MINIDPDDCPFLLFEERTALLSALALFKKPKQLNTEAFMYRWAPVLTKQMIEAYYDTRFQETIFILPNVISNKSKNTHWLLQLAPAILHELVHAEQHRALGRLLYSVCSLPIAHNILLDRTARRYEKMAENNLCTGEFS